MKHAVVDIETDNPLLKKLGQSYIFGEGSILGIGIYQVEENKIRTLATLTLFGAKKEAATAMDMGLLKS